MCLASGITTEAIAAEGGDSPAKGAWTCRSKKIAPVRRTAFSTSERTSIAVALVPDDRARKADNQHISMRGRVVCFASRSWRATVRAPCPDHAGWQRRLAWYQRKLGSPGRLHRPARTT